jgi:CRISPR/Cas system-associated exonuclease Cas4 (RecB family)
MFIIAAIIMIVILVILKTGVNIPDIMQKNRELEGKFEHDFFVNVVDELTKTIDISYHQSNNITNNVYDFANFTRKKMTERLQNFQFLYVSSITPKSSGSATMNISMINLLNKPINVTIQINTSPVLSSNRDNILDKSRWDTNFTITQGNNYILTVGYNGTYSENITIQTKVNQPVYIGFFDVALTGSKTTYKDKFQKSYTLP